MVRTQDLYWIAGFMEGEGSFIATKSGTLRLTAAQVQREPLERLQGLLGGTINHRQWRFGRVKPCAIYVWALTGAAAVGLSMALFAVMSPRRKGQISSSLQKWRAAKVSTRYRQTCPYGHPYDRFYMRGTQPTRRCSICDRRQWYESRARMKAIRG